jgi:hypothetical protein
MTVNSTELTESVIHCRAFVAKVMNRVQRQSSFERVFCAGEKEVKKEEIEQRN